MGGDEVARQLESALTYGMGYATGTAPPTTLKENENDRLHFATCLELRERRYE